MIDLTERRRKRIGRRSLLMPGTRPKTQPGASVQKGASSGRRNLKPRTPPKPRFSIFEPLFGGVGKGRSFSTPGGKTTVAAVAAGGSPDQSRSKRKRESPTRALNALAKAVEKLQNLVVAHSNTKIEIKEDVGKALSST